MFDQLVPEYDQFNRWSSLGLDQSWRREIASYFDSGQRVLDVGTGTGDVVSSLLNRGCRVTGIDFSERMLDAARIKFADDSSAEFKKASASELPFEAEIFDGVTSAFVIRNLHKGKVLSASLREFNRVLRPGGKMVHLELTRPPKGWWSQGHQFYLSYVLPVFGKAFFGHRWPEDYLCRTIENFCGPQELCQMLRWAGFNNVEHHSLFGGVAAIFVGVKC